MPAQLQLFSYPTPTTGHVVAARVQLDIASLAEGWQALFASTVGRHGCKDKVATSVTRGGRGRDASARP